MANRLREKNFWIVATLSIAAPYVLALGLALGGDAFASEAALTLGSLNEGDDRRRPAAGLHVGLGENYMARVWTYGRSFGPVTEQTGILSAVRRGAIFGSKDLRAAIGLCLMSEQTTISYSDGVTENKAENRYNFGATFGVYWDFRNWSPVYLTAGWESEVFLAGTAGILLSTGRKSILSAGMGVTLK